MFEAAFNRELETKKKQAEDDRVAMAVQTALAAQASAAQASAVDAATAAAAAPTRRRFGGILG